MPTRAEILLKRAAGLSAFLVLVSLAVTLAGTTSAWPAWPTLLFLYLTGVLYGFGDMTRLYHHHRRRCRECLAGAGPHLRWWSLRVLLVLTVAALPVLLLFPALYGRP